LSDDYLKSITGTVKPVYEEEKNRKIILDYKILSGEASGAQDFNILIMVEYANMAALDGLREKTDSIIERVIGPEKERTDMAVKRLDIREILASKTMREIWLKYSQVRDRKICVIRVIRGQQLPLRHPWQRVEIDVAAGENDADAP